ncbi:class F sortase [Micromonospora sediminimaris]|uniref:Class F sortase n=1 Tax=Micromonospora sediminimaris TaxID=547162 RepID=A0A9W5XKW7_9ACTN|nr:class F sortase [Micromonospora sediminimaris]GIJ34941.1 class F sortase [Micromonospora sediminimaris]SFD66843.1 Sortase family protein [Micromonospora sediminimaris]
MSSRPDATTGRAGGRHGGPWRAVGAAVVVVLAMMGSGLIGASLKTTDSPRPPQPVAGTSDPSPNGPLAEADLDGAQQVPTGLSRATPTTINIPRIGVRAGIMALGTNPDGTVQVPPLDQALLAGWYEPGPSPGEPGNSVIVGHVDSAAIGPAVFFSLGALQPGDTVSVERADGRTATFRVDSVASYPKDAFPTEQVYGPSDRPGLRVITCGGQFDEATGDYPDNVIVFASLIP